MQQYKESIEHIINDKQKRDKLVDRLFSAIQEGGYAGVILFCGNYLVGVNARNECVPCIPEEFLDNGKIIDQDSFDLCEKMNSERFDTKFSLFSLKIGLELLSKTSIEKQLLLSVDNKYVNDDASNTYLKQGYEAIPRTYRYELEKSLGGEDKVKEHLSRISSILYDRKGNQGKYNDYIVSEKFLLRRFYMKKKTIAGSSYNAYYHDLGKDFTSCSLELFHTLTILKEQKTRIFENLQNNDKILVLIFVPDACVSSAMQSGLAVSRMDDTFEVINVTQMTTMEEGVVMITKITKDGVTRL